MQREDLRSSTTDMPIVESVGNPNKQTNFKHNLLNKTMIFSLIFSDLKLGIFHRNTFWHWEYSRVTAKKDYCRNI